jgi:hypothetical protein
MASFKDAKDRVWPIRLTVAANRAVVAEHEIDLLILHNETAGVFSRLTDSTNRIVDVVWTLVRKHAEEIKVSAEEYLDSIDGDTIERMTQALIDGVIDFFRSNPEKVRVLKAAFEKQRTMEAEVATMAVAKIESLTVPPEILEGTTGSTSTGSPASPA